MAAAFTTARSLPKLTLVGAGPGDPELITLKGLKALRCADVVLYDALASRALLEVVPAHCIQIFVGKRGAKKAFNQTEINDLIVDYARRSGHVVRLKGGDPFVFGRGGEEMSHALAHGIPVEYVPGISSAIAVPGAVGIPVTLRGASRGFWVLTATTDSGELNPDILAAARLDTSLVVLMGLSKLPQIAAAYAAAGKAEWPIAVIQDGTLPTQKVATGKINGIVEQAKHLPQGSPAVIVVGPVVQQSLPIETIFNPAHFSQLAINTSH